MDETPPFRRDQHLMPEALRAARRFVDAYLERQRRTRILPLRPPGLAPWLDLNARKVRR